MSKTKHTRNWAKKHIADPYVQRSVRDGLRSRAAYKLQEMQDKYKFIKPGMCVIDLGAAPGSWSQVASHLVGLSGQVVSIDLLPMSSLDGVSFIEGDFTDETVYHQLLTMIPEQKADVILSDMAPNLSGHKNSDQAKSIYLIELALELAHQVLVPQGTLAFKAFHGRGLDECVNEIKKAFKTVNYVKPKASRAQSREIYVLARNYRI